MRFRLITAIILAALLALPYYGAVSCTAPDKPHSKVDPEPEDKGMGTPELEEGDAGAWLDIQEPLDGSTYKILLIGNSLTIDASCFLPQLLNAAGVKNVELTRTYHGAYTLQLYNKNYSNTGICAIYHWKPGQARWSGTNETLYAPQRAAEYDKYDIIVLQDYPGNQITWTWSEDLRTAVDGLIGKLRASQKSSKAKILLHFPHTHGNTYENTTVAHFNGSSVEFFNTVAPVFKHILDDTDVEDVISTGAMIQSLRTSGLNLDPDIDLTRGDAVHMDYGMIRYAAGLLLFKKLITPLTGIDIKSIPWRFREYFPCEKSEINTPVLDANMPLLYEAIDSAIAYPWSICNLSNRPVSTDYKVDPSGPETLDSYADFPGAEPFPVLFPIGNGRNTSEKQPYWLPYRIWVSPSERSYAKWYMASIPNPEVPTYCVAFSNGAISSPAVKGVWTDDYFEFRIPVKNFAAGTKVKFTAPMYCRESPVFWVFEWFDGDSWKSNATTMQSPGGAYSRNASFVLDYPTTLVEQTASFDSAVTEGFLRFRLRCADGSIVSSASGSCEEVSVPVVDAANGVPAGAVYFYASGENEVKFEIVQ